MTTYEQRPKKKQDRPNIIYFTVDSIARGHVTLNYTKIEAANVFPLDHNHLIEICYRTLHLATIQSLGYKMKAINCYRKTT